jgi:thiol-disulfide isomerase/thioredoxin
LPFFHNALILSWQQVPRTLKVRGTSISTGIISLVHINDLVPDFSLPDQNGQLHRLSEYRGKLVIVNFWSAECPWSERADKSLAVLQDRFPGQVVVLPIASNVNESDEMVNEAIHQWGIGLVLRDAGCELADLWQAQTTPHAFVIDQSGILRYRGAVDDVTFRKKNPSMFYVEEAVKALINGRLPDMQETLSYGCAIVRIQ